MNNPKVHFECNDTDKNSTINDLKAIPRIGDEIKLGYKDTHKVVSVTHEFPETDEGWLTDNHTIVIRLK